MAAADAPNFDRPGRKAGRLVTKEEREFCSEMVNRVIECAPCKEIFTRVLKAEKLYEEDKEALLSQVTFYAESTPQGAACMVCIYREVYLKDARDARFDTTRTEEGLRKTMQAHVKCEGCRRFLEQDVKTRRVDRIHRYIDKHLGAKKGPWCKDCREFTPLPAQKISLDPTKDVDVTNDIGSVPARLSNALSHLVDVDLKTQRQSYEIPLPLFVSILCFTRDTVWIHCKPKNKEQYAEYAKSIPEGEFVFEADTLYTRSIVNDGLQLLPGHRFLDHGWTPLATKIDCDIIACACTARPDGAQPMFVVITKEERIGRCFGVDKFKWMKFLVPKAALNDVTGLYSLRTMIYDDRTVIVADPTQVRVARFDKHVVQTYEQAVFDPRLYPDARFCVIPSIGGSAPLLHAIHQMHERNPDPLRDVFCTRVYNMNLIKKDEEDDATVSPAVVADQNIIPPRRFLQIPGRMHFENSHFFESPSVGPCVALVMIEGVFIHRAMPPFHQASYEPTPEEVARGITEEIKCQIVGNTHFVTYIESRDVRDVFYMREKDTLVTVNVLGEIAAIPLAEFTPEKKFTGTELNNTMIKQKHRYRIPLTAIGEIRNSVTGSIFTMSSDNKYWICLPLNTRKLMRIPAADVAPVLEYSVEEGIKHRFMPGLDDIQPADPKYLVRVNDIMLANRKTIFKDKSLTDAFIAICARILKPPTMGQLNRVVEMFVLYWYTENKPPPEADIKSLYTSQKNVEILSNAVVFLSGLYKDLNPDDADADPTTVTLENFIDYGIKTIYMSNQEHGRELLTQIYTAMHGKKLVFDDPDDERAFTVPDDAARTESHPDLLPPPLGYPGPPVDQIQLGPDDS